MASLLNLPQELINNIISDLSKRDCKSLRLTSSQLAVSAIPGVARDAHFALHPRSWRSLQTLAADSRFSQHVESLTLFANILPEISSYAGWKSTLNTKPYRDQAGRHDNYKPVSEILYRKYSEYLDAIKTQQEMISSSAWEIELRNLLKTFPRLHQFNIPMWYDCWRSVPTAEHCGGQICTFDEFWHLLKPKGFPANPGTEEFYFERWAVDNDETPDVFRSSIIQARLIGASLLLPLQNSSPHNNIRIDTMELALSFDAHYEDYTEFMEPDLVDGQGLNDADRYQRIVITCVESVENCRASSLNKLSLHIQDSAGFEPCSTMLRAFRRFLNAAVSLTELSVRLDPCDENGGYDLLGDLRSCTIPRLQTLHLTSSYMIFTSKESLESLIHNHAKTLRSLSLNRIAFNFEDDRTWSDLLQTLPKVLSLDTFSISTISDERGRGGESYGGEWYFEDRKDATYKAVCNHVLGRGPWPHWPGDLRC